ncbi:WD repeat-containing protein [Pseudozyma hubeiensis SY62]|uniref:WD repeat-containing protein n=1 Tax=Pseudozyma hubeiensis (strain SY62) TaxID=1305764 RepID=R9P337_PSEHS|nr:WD repeat-containing protein [Pseudozyma hubeiensis SY62]GAC95719.1 WD repeat-containing protein [Pseudozyma hubeiensis SY62]
MDASTGSCGSDAVGPHRSRMQRCTVQQRTSRYGYSQGEQHLRKGAAMVVECHTGSFIAATRPSQRDISDDAQERNGCEVFPILLKWLGAAFRRRKTRQSSRNRAQAQIFVCLISSQRSSRSSQHVPL